MRSTRLWTRRACSVWCSQPPAPDPGPTSAGTDLAPTSSPLNLGKLTIDRDAFIPFIRELRRQGIGASVRFIPIPLHPFFVAHAGLPRNQYPRALEFYPRLVSLLLCPSMTPKQVDYAAAAVQETARAAGKTKSTAVTVSRG